jgi:cytochrome oxidase Cu insertion factor (SCO1/SenC/PrrC family)
MRFRLVVSLLVLVGSLPAQGGWKDLTGKRVPELKVAAWLNTDGAEPTSASLKGKVWLLEFFGTY